MKYFTMTGKVHLSAYQTLLNKAVPIEQESHF